MSIGAGSGVMSIGAGSRCLVCLSIFLFENAVLCKTVLTNCLLKAEAFCWEVFAGLLLIVMMMLGVDGGFFPFSRFKVKEVQINNVKFAYDITLVAESGDDLQFLITKTDTESQRFGMTISTAKTEVQCIPPMKKPLDMEIKEKN